MIMGDMSELLKKLIELAERYWHKKAAAALIPLLTVLGLLAFQYVTFARVLSVESYLFSIVAGAVVAIVWLLTNRLPRVEKDKIGIVIAILCDGPDEDKQVRLDFVATLKTLAMQGNAQLQLVELPSWVLDDLEDPRRMSHLLLKVRGHFLLYGRVRMRNKDSKPVHILTFNGMVRHSSVPEAVSNMLASDFTSTIPKHVVIPKENDAFTFQATSEWTDICARYIIGMAAFISGSVGYAELMFTYVKNILEQSKQENVGILQVSKMLPLRFKQLYNNWQTYLYDRYFSTHEHQYLIKLDEISSKLLVCEPTSYTGLQVKAICEFILRRNTSGAHDLIGRCKHASDSSWLYGQAFLFAYEGKMKEAARAYNNAFKGRLIDKSVPIQCEEFIHIVLSAEPDKIQMHYCLGLLNFYGKRDYIAAKQDLVQFLSKRKDKDFEHQAKEARLLIEKCKKPEDTSL